MPDDLVTELRVLRKGRGVTLDKLSRSRTLLEALGTSDAMEATRLLSERLDSLGKGDKVRALQHAFGLSGRKDDLLTARRSYFADEIQRSVDTVENYENEIIEELAVALTSKEPELVRSGEITIVAHVIQGVIGSVVKGFTPEGDEPTPEGYSNMTNRAPSIPALIYRVPPAYKHAAKLVIGVAFEDEPTPQYMWAAGAPSMLGVIFGQNRISLDLKPSNRGKYLEGGYTFLNPRAGDHYAVAWLY